MWKYMMCVMFRRAHTVQNSPVSNKTGVQVQKWHSITFHKFCCTRGLDKRVRVFMMCMYTQTDRHTCTHIHTHTHTHTEKNLFVDCIKDLYYSSLPNHIMNKVSPCTDSAKKMYGKIGGGLKLMAFLIGAHVCQSDRVSLTWVHSRSQLTCPAGRSGMTGGN